VLNERVERYLIAIGPERLRAAEISGANHEMLPWREHTSLDYPEFDLCAVPSSERRYDVVICEQILEHLPDPFTAAANLRVLCEPGGWVVVSTPFLIPIHELEAYEMWDYWRFTPRGLRTLLERVGLEVERVDSWGNRQAVLGNLRRWSARRRWHSNADNPRTPVQVWAFARRPL
jgi:SAM-dependent methyltransferase